MAVCPSRCLTVAKRGTGKSRSYYNG